MVEEERSFDYVLYKVPTVDKKGNDISGDKVDTGGRRRRDGTLSGAAYDPVMLDDVHIGYGGENSGKVTRYEDLSWGQQLVVDCVKIVVDKASDYAYKLAMQSLEKWLKNREEKKRIPKEKAKKSKVLTTKVESIVEHSQAQQHTNQQNNNTEVGIDFYCAYNSYKSDMTSEEAQKDLIDAYCLHMIAARKVWKVANSNIVDRQGKKVDGHCMLEQLSSPQILGEINLLLSRNPGLLDVWEQQALSVMLNRDILVEDRYVPITHLELQNGFALQSGMTEENV